MFIIGWINTISNLITFKKHFYLLIEYVCQIAVWEYWAQKKKLTSKLYLS